MSSKKVFAVVLMLMFAITMVTGCGGDKAAAPAEGEKPETVKIGMNAELSGAVSVYGQSVVKSMKMAFDEINEAGGINGMQIEVIEYDNKSDVAEALNIATKLASQDEVSIMVGPITSGNAIATIPATEQYQIPMVTPTGTNADITVNPKTGETNEYMFRTCFIDPFQGRVAAKYAYENLGLKTAAIYVDNNSDYSKGLEAEFTKEFESLGGKVVLVEGFVVEDRDFKATLTKIKAENPEMIYVPAFYEQVALIIKQVRELGYEGTLIGSDGWDSPKLAEVNSAENLQNAYYINHYSTEDTDPKVVEFIKKYQEKFGDTPDSFAALGYDCAYITADAIKRADSTDPEKIKEALAATKDYVGVTGTTTLDEQHNPIKSAVILGFNEEGNPTFIDKINP